MKSNLSVAESQALWEKYCDFMNPYKVSKPEISYPKTNYSRKVVYDDWEPVDSMVMETLRQLEDAGSSQFGDY